MPAASLLTTVFLVATSVPPGIDLPLVETELQQLWASAARVAVRTQPDAAAAGGRTVWLRFADDLGPGAHASALGWTPFTDGAPGAVITVSPARIGRAVARPAPGHLPAEPAAVSSGTLSRATGRVVAHELGHVLLRAPGHDRTGLMREAFSRDDLHDARPRRLRLPTGAGARLRAPDGTLAAGTLAHPHWGEGR